MRCEKKAGVIYSEVLSLNNCQGGTAVSNGGRLLVELAWREAAGIQKETERSTGAVGEGQETPALAASGRQQSDVPEAATGPGEWGLRTGFDHLEISDDPDEAVPKTCWARSLTLLPSCRSTRAWIYLPPSMPKRTYVN